jgi:hypothetical protein
VAGYRISGTHAQRRDCKKCRQKNPGANSYPMLKKKKTGKYPDFVSLLNMLLPVLKDVVLSKSISDVASWI